MDRYFQSLDEVNKFILPLNSITQSLGHLKEDGENQRVIVSAKTDKPLTWKLSKIENTKPIGLIKVTLKEDVFNPHTDYIEKDSNGNIIGMWADYYDNDITPIEDGEDDVVVKSYTQCVVNASQYTIKNGGSYRTITNSYINNEGTDVSSEYITKDKEYSFKIDNDDVSEYVKYVVQDDTNVIKIKFNNSDYIGKMLTVKTICDGISGEIKLEII